MIQNLVNLADGDGLDWHHNQNTLAVEGTGLDSTISSSGILTINPNKNGNGTAEMVFQSATGTLYNAGTVTVSNTGNASANVTNWAKFTLEGLGLSNSGTISVSASTGGNNATGHDNALLTLDGSKPGSTFVNTATGSIIIDNTQDSGHTGNSSAALLLTGNVTLDNEGTITLQHSGTELTAGRAASQMTLGWDATITGNGMLTVGTNTSIVRDSSAGATIPTLYLASNVTLQGGGQIGDGNINLALQSGGALWVQGGSPTTATISTNGPVNNGGGLVVVTAGKQLDLTQNFHQDAGTLSVDGTLSFAAGKRVDLAGGTLSANSGGQIIGTVSNSGGTLWGPASGNFSLNGDYSQSGGTLSAQAGTLTVTGTYIQTGGDLEMGGGTVDDLNGFDVSGGTVGGSGTLGGGNLNLSGTAALSVAAGQALTVAADLNQSAGSTATVDGLLTASSVDVGAGSTLSGAGTVQAPVTVEGALTGTLTIADNLTIANGGSVDPAGSGAIGSIYVTGDYFETGPAAPQIDLDVNGTTADRINILGAGGANLAGKLNLNVMAPAAYNWAYVLMFAPSGFNSLSLNWDISGLSPGWQVLMVGDRIEALYNSPNGAVPEPFSFVLLGSGLIALGAYAKCRRRPVE